MLIIGNPKTLSEQSKIDAAYFILESVWAYLCWNDGHASMHFINKLTDDMLAKVSPTAHTLAKMNARKWEYQ